VGCFISRMVACPQRKLLIQERSAFSLAGSPFWGS
jgi:hypothetical protein